MRTRIIAMTVLCLITLFSQQAMSTDYTLVAARSVPGGSTTSQPLLLYSFCDTGPLGDNPEQVIEYPSLEPSFLTAGPQNSLYVGNRGLCSAEAGSVEILFIGDNCQCVDALSVTSPELQFVHGVAVSDYEEVYAANYLTGLISRFTFNSNGAILWGTPINTNKPVNLGLVLGPDGDLFSSHGLHGIQRIELTTTGALLHNLPVGSGDFHGMAFNAAGELFVADLRGSVLHVSFDYAGNANVKDRIAISGGPIDVAFSPEGELFASTHFDGAIHRFLFDDSGYAYPNPEAPIKYTGGNLSGIEIVEYSCGSEPLVDAHIDIDPDTLNLKSNGRWITCYVTFADGLDVSSVDPETILFCDAVKPMWSYAEDEEQVLKVKFSRSEVQQLLAEYDALQPGEVEVFLEGKFTDGTEFEGTDVIRIIDPGHDN